MKYCITYDSSNANCKYLNEVDEILINYNRKDLTLLDFMLEHQEQRIIIMITWEGDFLDNNCIEIFKHIHESYPELNFAFCFWNIPDNEKLLKVVQDSELPFFFGNFVKDWDTLHYFKKFNPTDMYVTESLGFEIQKVAAVLAPAGIKVRCFPNVAQSAAEMECGLKTFFIRPEDVEKYSEYVDVLEFFGDSVHMDTYYKIYTKDKKWFGKLKEIIAGLKSDIDSRHIPEQFADSRMNCGKRCLKGSGCKLCESVEALSATLDRYENKVAELKQNS